uniref:MFS transporter n=1 Tax=Stappia sp. TaxID=1870903 RepID=UPI003BA9B997
MTSAQTTSGSSLMANWPTLAVAALGSFLVILDVTVVAIALPSIERELKASFAELQWIINAYNIAYTSVLIAVGALADWFGRRRVMVIGLALFGLTSLMVGMAETPTALILGRVAQGLSASAMLILGVALISNAFQGSDRAQAFAIWGVSIGCGAAFGPIVGGILVDLLSWRWIFLLNVPIVATLIALCYWRVEESSDPNAGSLDWTGILLFTGALACLSYGVIEGGELGWSNGAVVGAFVASAVLFVLFTILELALKRPAFDLRLFRIPTFTGIQLVCVLNSITFWVMLVYLPIYFQVVHGMSASAAGLMLMPMTIPLLLFAPMGAKLASPERWGVRNLIAFGCALIAVGFLWLAIAPPAEVTLWVIAFLLLGIGTGLINGEMSNVATAVVPAEKAGIASGVNITFRHGSFTLSISVFGAILLSSITMQLSGSADLATALGDGVRETANLIARGDFAGAVTSAPTEIQSVVETFGRASFSSAFSVLLWIVALLSVAAIALSALMIRRRDLHAGPEAAASPAGE